MLLIDFIIIIFNVTISNVMIYICSLDILTFFSTINNSAINFSFHLAIIRAIQDFKIVSENQYHLIVVKIVIYLIIFNVKHILFV